MTGVISQEEFERFQTQLLDLREEKYQCNESRLKAERHARQLQERVGQLEKELKVTNDTLSRTRHTKDVGELVRENAALRDRLLGIESNFQLQNETLRLECQHLMSENERLQCQLETYKSISKAMESQTPVDVNGVSSNGADLNEENHEGTPISGSSSCPSPAQNISREKTLQLEVTKLCEEKDRIELQLKAFQVEIAQLSSEKDALTKKVFELETANTNVSSKLVAAEQTNLRKIDNLQSQIEELRDTYEEELRKTNTRMEKERRKAVAKADADRETLRNDLEQEAALMKMQHEGELAALKTEMEAARAAHAETLVEMEAKHTLDIEALREILTAEVEEVRRQSSVALENHKLQLDKKEKELHQVKEKLGYATEEVKSTKRKHDRQCKDLKRQLDKEVRRAEELQARLTELVRSGGAGIEVNLLQSGRAGSGMGAPDDASSVYSLTNSNADGGPGSALGSASNTSLLETDLMGVIERLTTTQEDNCDLKRQLGQLQDELASLRATLSRKDSIIQRYISSRGGAQNPAMRTSTSTPDGGFHASPPAPSTPHQSSSPSKHKPPASSFPFVVSGNTPSLSQMMQKMANSSISQRAVAESFQVKQLQHVCEEVMTRTLQLEEDLKAMSDENMRLRNQLGESS